MLLIMKLMYASLFLVLFLVACQPVPPLPESAPVQKNVDLFGQDLDQYVDSQEISDEVQGFLAKPKEPGNYPGIIMIHEWWGLNDNIKEMAKILANEGYVVFAIDLYDGKVAMNSTQAGEYAGQVRGNPTKVVAELKAAVAYLKSNEDVTKVGSLGWCFGGGQSLQLS